MRKRIAALLLCLLLTLTACAPQEKGDADEGYRLYYPPAELRSEAGEDAIVSVTTQIENAEQMDAEAIARELLTRLLAGEEAHLPALPYGTYLRSISIAGQLAKVDLSSHYAALSGVDLTLTDYCITLTLTQLPGVNAVTITADGRRLPQRKVGILTAADPLLGISEDTLRPIEATLYFRDKESRELRGEARVIALYEGQSRVHALLEALHGGPENSAALERALNEDFHVLSSRVEERLCYLNLPEDALDGEENVQQAVDALVLSLCSLDFIDAVQIVVEGEFVEQLGGVFIAEPLSLP